MRVPHWAEQPTLTVNGAQLIPHPMTAGGWWAGSGMSRRGSPGAAAGAAPPSLTDAGRGRGAIAIEYAGVLPEAVDNPDTGLTIHHRHRCPAGGGPHDGALGHATILTGGRVRSGSGASWWLYRFAGPDGEELGVGPLSAVPPHLGNGTQARCGSGCRLPRRYEQVPGPVAHF
jgi:hypothetical protein